MLFYELVKGGEKPILIYRLFFRLNVARLIILTTFAIIKKLLLW